MIKKKPSYLAALTCALAIFISMYTPAIAAQSEGDVSVHASDYLTSYAAWATVGTNSNVYINYNVTATGFEPRVGAKLVVIQVLDAGDWTDVKTINGTITNGMLEQNVSCHGGSVSYQGTAGKSYRAVVTVYAGPASGGDSRIITTNSVVAQ